MILKKYPTPCRIIIMFNLLIVFGLLCFYFYQFNQFNIKVKEFNKFVDIGDSMQGVTALLGRPSYYDPGLDRDQVPDEIKSELNEFVELVYRGDYFLRDHIVLYFEAETSKLVYKKRVMMIWKKIYK